MRKVDYFVFAFALSQTIESTLLLNDYWLFARELRKKRKLRYKEMRLQNPDGCIKRQKLEKITTKNNFGSSYHIAIDLSFNDLMPNKDLRKLGKQIGWCYQVNRRSATPVQVCPILIQYIHYSIVLWLKLHFITYNELCVVAFINSSFWNGVYFVDHAANRYSKW